MLSLLGNSLKTIHINTYFDIVCLFNVLIMCLDIINYNKPVPFPHKKTFENFVVIRDHLESGRLIGIIALFVLPVKHSGHGKGQGY